MCTLGLCFRVFHFIMIDEFHSLRLRGNSLRQKKKKWDASVQVIFWSSQLVLKQVKWLRLLIQGLVKIRYYTVPDLTPWILVIEMPFSLTSKGKWLDYLSELFLMKMKCSIFIICFYTLFNYSYWLLILNLLFFFHTLHPMTLSLHSTPLSSSHPLLSPLDSLLTPSSISLKKKELSSQG